MGTRRPSGVVKCDGAAWSIRRCPSQPISACSAGDQVQRPQIGRAAPPARCGSSQPADRPAARRRDRSGSPGTSATRARRTAAQPASTAGRCRAAPSNAARAIASAGASSSGRSDRTSAPSRSCRRATTRPSRRDHSTDLVPVRCGRHEARAGRLRPAARPCGCAPRAGRRPGRWRRSARPPPADRPRPAPPPCRPTARSAAPVPVCAAPIRSG